jgi:hypothetical protein
MLHHRRIDTDGGDVEGMSPDIMRCERLLAKRGDLAGCVFAFKRREIDHRHREAQAEDLRLLFDAARGVFGDTFLDADMIDGANFAEELAESLRCCGHGWDSGTQGGA